MTKKIFFMPFLKKSEVSTMLNAKDYLAHEVKIYNFPKKSMFEHVHGKTP